MKISSLLSATLLATALGGAAFANPMVGGADMMENMTIVDNAMNSADHTTLVAAVAAGGLVDTLKGAGPFTVFAPTNEAFAALPAGTVDTLLLPENKDTLVKVLTCHVVAGTAMSEAVAGMITEGGGSADITTLGGCVIKASVVDGVVTLTDENGGAAHVTIADVVQSNGVIHVVDAVILPKM